MSDTNATPPAEDDEVLHGVRRSDLVSALKTVMDPEIPVDIYELGLIYRVDVQPSGDVEIDMTLTAPGCPVAEEMPGMVANAVEAVPGVRNAQVRLVWDPPWDRAKMSEDAQMQLGFF